MTLARDSRDHERKLGCSPIPSAIELCSEQFLRNGKSPGRFRAVRGYKKGGLGHAEERKERTAPAPQLWIWLRNIRPPRDCVHANEQSSEETSSAPNGRVDSRTRKALFKRKNTHRRHTKVREKKSAISANQPTTPAQSATIPSHCRLGRGLSPGTAAPGPIGRPSPYTSCL